MNKCLIGEDEVAILYKGGLVKLKNGKFYSLRNCEFLPGGRLVIGIEESISENYRASRIKERKIESKRKTSQRQDEETRNENPLPVFRGFGAHLLRRPPPRALPLERVAALQTFLCLISADSILPKIKEPPPQER